MNFIHKRPNPSYHFVTPELEQEIRRLGRKVHIPAAEFHNHRWNSEAAQAENRWSDEFRIQIEEYLKSLPDYGTLMRDETDQMHQAFQEAMEPGQARTEHCRFTVVASGGPVLCGKATFPGTDYCKPHLLEIFRESKKEEAKGKTARQKTPEEVGV